MRTYKTFFNVFVFLLTVSSCNNSKTSNLIFSCENEFEVDTNFCNDLTKVKSTPNDLKYIISGDTLITSIVTILANKNNDVFEYSPLIEQKEDKVNLKLKQQVITKGEGEWKTNFEADTYLITFKVLHVNPNTLYHVNYGGTAE